MSTHVLARLSAQRRWVRQCCVIDRREFGIHTTEADYYHALAIVRRGF